MPEITYYPIDDEAARNAHDANSFREFKSDEPGYRDDVDDVYKLADAAADRDPDVADEAYRLADRYAREYAAWINDGYRIEAMCPSVMVSGAANFPTRKKERQNAAREHHFAELEKIDKIPERIKRLGDPNAPIKADDPKAIEKLRTKIAAAEERHEAMKRANREARKENRPAPHPPYELANSRKRIKSAKQRLADLEAQKAAGSQERKISIYGEECEVVENAEIMRLQLVFDEKPSAETRELLIKYGFRWAPSKKAWQRQLTENARRAVKRLEKDGRLQ